MATTPRVFIKRSSVVGKVPTSGSLNYGELAINFADGKLYYKDDSDNIRAFIDSARVQAIADAIEVVANAQLDSGEVTSLIDSSYVQARVPITYLQTLIDSAYVNLRADDYTGFDSDFNAKSTSDLSEGSNLYYTKTRVDSDIASSLNDSGNTVTITINNIIQDTVDSDYVLARVNEAPFLDSAAVIPIIDSHVDKAFVDALNVDADTLDGLNGAHYLNYQNLTNKPTILDTVDVSNIITTDVDKAFVDALNVNADTLDGYHAQYFIDKIDSNVASQLDSSEVIALVDSAYIQARVDTTYIESLIDQVYLDSADAIQLIDSAYIQLRQDYAYGSLTGAPTNVSSFTNDANYLDSTTVTGVINASYIQSNQIKYNTSDFTDSSFVTGLPVSTFTNDANYLDSTTVQSLLPKFGTDYIDSSTVIDIINSEGLDSDLVIALVDSAYIQLRDRFQDSSLVTSTVDSSYIQIRVPESYLSTIIDSDYVNARVSSTDSTAVIQIIDSHVTQTFVNSLNIDADNLDGQTGTFYLDYNNFSNTPTIPTLGNDFVDSNEVITLIDSDYIELRRPAETIFGVSNNGASAYTFTGDGFSSGRDNPTLYLTRGKTYKFEMNASGHPFQIRVSSGGSAYSTGVTNNGAQTGDIFFTPDMNAPNNLVYQCTVHSGMVGNIVIIDTNTFLDSASATSLIDSAYILARSPAGIDSDLVIQIIDSDYVAARSPAGGTDSATVSAIIAVDVDSAYIQARQLSVTAADFTQTTNTFTADSGQVSFTGLDIDSNKFQVYLNGLLLPRSDFTHNSSKVDLLVAADSGDILEVIKFGGNLLGLDSANTNAFILATVDSAYVQARQSSVGTGGLDSALVTQLIDSAYVAARTTAGTDSATVSSIITADVDSDFIFDIIKIKAKKKYYIQPNQPTISELGEYWYKSDSDILYKSVPNTTLTTTMPGYQITSTVHYNKIYDWAGNNPSSATRTNISGTDALGGSFTSGTTASAWFYFTATLTPSALNASADYQFDSAQDLRGIIIENSDPNAGRLERIDYQNGDYADNGFPGGGTVTWYNSSGTALGKTANANTTGNTFVDISHPSGVKATKIGFSQVGDYYSGNDVFLFFAGNPIWQEIDRARTSSDLGLDSAAVTSLIDSAYINARVSFDSDTVTQLVDSAYIQLRDRFQDSSGILAIVDSAYVQARQSSGGGTGTVDSAYVLSVVDSAAIPFTQTFFHFTADSAQTVFSGADDDSETLSYNANALSVYLNGILLVDSVDYTATNGTSVTLLDAAALGDVVTVLKYTGNSVGLDSAGVINLIDSAYINARVGAGTVEAIVDSAYIQLRDRFQDSAGILAIVDSAYVAARSMTDIVEDTTPQLGGHLEGNGYDIYLSDDDIYAWGASPGRTNIQGKASTSYSTNYIKFNVRTGNTQSTEIAKFTEDDGLYTTIGLNFANWNTALNDYYDLKIKGPTSNSLVANETIRFPDSSGTVALTKDVLDSAEVISLITGSDLDMQGNKVLFGNIYDSTGAFPNASSYHGMFAHAHNTGAGYFAHAGNWVRLANYSELSSYGDSDVTALVDSAYVQLRQSAATNIDSIGAIGNVNAIGATEGQILKFDSASQKFILATDGGGSGGLDSALVTQLIDSAYVQARQTSGGAGGLDSALVSQLIDSDYIGTKVDFTRGEFVNEKSQYTATASQTVFNHSSIDPTHLDVYLNGVLQVVNDDYTATSSAVTFTSGVDSGYSVTIVEKRGRVLTQRGLVESKYYFTTATPTTSITGTDDNGLTLDYSVGSLDVYLNGMLLKDSDDYSTNAGTTVTLVSATDSNDLVTLINRKGVVVTPNVKNYEYTATAGQLTFSGMDINSETLAYVPDAIQVYLNGILLRNVDYTAVNGTSITLADSATLNDELVVSAFSSPGHNMDLYKFTADSGQTIFNGNDTAGASLAYNPGNIQVFMNGLLLNDSDDYTALNGMSVVLTEAANINDEIKIASFVANTTTLRTNAWTAPTGSTVQAAAGDKLFIDVSSSAKTVTLPSSATMGDEIRIIDVTGYAATNNITVGRNGHKIQGSASDLTININRAGIGLVYYNTAQGWVLIEN